MIKKKGRLWKIFLGILILAMLLAVPKFLNAYYMHIIILIIFYAFAASGWNIFGGYVGQFFFAHVVFIAIGAYTSTLLYNVLKISPWIGMLAGGGLAVLLAGLLGILMFRANLSGTYFALGTLALLEITRSLALTSKTLGGARGLYILAKGNSLINMCFKNKAGYYYIILALLLGVLWVVKRVQKSRVGAYFIAIRENEEAARAIGIDTMRYKMTALCLSAFISAVAGTFYAQYITYFDPYTIITFEMAVQIISTAIIGGTGTVMGPVLGAAVIIPLGESIRGYLGQSVAGIHLVIYGLCLMLTILFLPNGLAGFCEDIKKKVQKKLYAGNVVQACATLENEEKPVPNLLQKYRGEQEGTMLLDVKNINKSFAGLIAIDDVSFQVKKGEILGIMGPNGAGKTTIFSMLTGFLTPTHGRIRYKGNDITKKPPHLICEMGLARTFQVVQPFPGLNVIETATIAAYKNTKDTKQAREIAKHTLKMVGMESKELIETKKLNLPDLKRLEVAKALCTGAEVILLDEVMAGLTEVEVQEMVAVIKELREEGYTFVIIEHVMSAMMSLVDRLIVIDYGRMIAEGRPEEVVKNKEVITAYLGGDEAC